MGHSEYYDGSIEKENNKQAVPSRSMNPSNGYPYLQKETTTHSHSVTTSIEGFPFPPCDRHTTYQPPTPDKCCYTTYQVDNDNTPRSWHGSSPFPHPPPVPPSDLDHTLVV
ncbi:MAG: hypothetical protein ACI8RD_007016 [Bacillariaceae sp.]|jgi:hypothetical protein